MIGVLAKTEERSIVPEFFELFKTPWEFCVPGRHYDAVIVTTNETEIELSADLLLVYSSARTVYDESTHASYEADAKGEWLHWNGVEFPTYGRSRIFETEDEPVLRFREALTGAAGYSSFHASVPLVRIGYDLFDEFSFLLSVGQPPQHAHVPTGEVHIALLRSCLIAAGVAFAEIPASPSGYRFMASLTHDVDFVGIRQHRFDRTMLGFLFRALLGSLYQALRGRLAWRKVARNWKAVLTLPFVHLGWAPDFWLEFERYMAIEKDLGSTFFFLPYKNRPGGDLSAGTAPVLRAGPYDLTEVQDEVRRLEKAGCEIGLHGIDAWRDCGLAREEASKIQALIDCPEIGIRMHWLYFNDQSPRILRDAGCSYDSTMGYNDAVGFRAGTGQVFCLPNSGGLLELPLTIQDTALFYPGRMHLSEADAMTSCDQVLKAMLQFGGVMTLNWHTRSLSPERLWGEFYIDLLERIRKCGAWFATARHIVRWFQARRAVSFKSVEFAQRRVHVKLSGTPPVNQAPLVVRIYHPCLGPREDSEGATSRTNYVDIPWLGEEILESAF